MRKQTGKRVHLKKHTLAQLTNWHDDLATNFKLLLMGETARHRIEPLGAMPSELRRRVFELPDVRFLKCVRQTEI